MAISELGSAWNPAPVVLIGAGLALLRFGQAFACVRRRGRADHAPWSRIVLFVLAVVLGTLALVSPLDEVGDSYLLSGHMLQHVLIGDVAPALALVALRGPLLFFVVPRCVVRAVARATARLRPAPSFAIWLLVIAGWHVPAAYDFALRHQAAHDLEHLSFLLAGLLVWQQIVDPARRRHLRLGQRLGYMLALTGAGGMLAAVLVVSPSPLFPAYASGAVRLFGLTPLDDQRLAGLVMLAEQLLMLGVCTFCLLRIRVPGASTHRYRRARPSTGRYSSMGLNV
jgi:cytochrome c oxidase assembly factor CtaG